MSRVTTLLCMVQIYPLPPPGNISSGPRGGGRGGVEVHLFQPVSFLLGVGRIVKDRLDQWLYHTTKKLFS